MIFTSVEFCSLTLFTRHFHMKIGCETRCYHSVKTLMQFVFFFWLKEILTGKITDKITGYICIIFVNVREGKYYIVSDSITQPSEHWISRWYDIFNNFTMVYKVIGIIEKWTLLNAGLFLNLFVIRNLTVISHRWDKNRMIHLLSLFHHSTGDF